MSTRVPRRTPKVLICIGAALIFVAIVAALWPRSVTYDGARRTCSPQIGDFVPSDPGPGYPIGLVEECDRRQQPERITMVVSGLVGIVIEGIGLSRNRRPPARWTPPPNWPTPPPGWRPAAGWLPPPDWPQPPPGWQWWQRPR